MAGAKGCNDDCASAIIFILNSVLLILSILGFVGIGYTWTMQSNLKEGEQVFSAAIPEFILVLAIFVLIVILSVALLGIIATALQMKENTDEANGEKDNGSAKKAKGEKDNGSGIKRKKSKADTKQRPCCHSWGLGIYVFLCIMAFFFLLAVAVVCGIYSDKMSNFDSLDKVRDKGDSWIDTLEDHTKDQVLELAKEYPKTWDKTQEAIGCCGWNVDNTTVTAFTNSTCCHDNKVVNSVDIIGKIDLEYKGCRKDGAGKVYTCEGVIASYVQGNLVKTSFCSAALSIIQLALAICGCVVRYPQLFAYCNCKKKNETVTPDAATHDPVHKIQHQKTPNGTLVGDI